MFTWQKQMAALDLPASKILRLARSLVDIQVALPGLPVQEARAYIIVHEAGTGCRPVVALHLLSTGGVAYFVNDAGDAPVGDADQLYYSGFSFAESMGFMLGDLDFQLLDEQDRESLWSSLPLRHKAVPAAKVQDRPAPPLSVQSLSESSTSAKPGSPQPTAKPDEGWKPDAALLLPPDKTGDAPPRAPVVSNPPTSSAVPSTDKTAVPSLPAAPASVAEEESGRPPAPPAASAAVNTEKTSSPPAPPLPVQPTHKPVPGRPSPAELKAFRQRYRQQLGRLLASF